MWFHASHLGEKERKKSAEAASKLVPSTQTFWCALPFRLLTRKLPGPFAAKQKKIQFF